MEIKMLPFDIKYRDKIESGEYQVVSDCGRPVKIYDWNFNDEFPIVCMVDKDDAIPFRTDRYGNPQLQGMSHLHICQKLTRFGKAVREFYKACREDERTESYLQIAESGLLAIAKEELGNLEWRRVKDPSIPTVLTDEGDYVVTEDILVKNWVKYPAYSVIQRNTMVNREMYCIPLSELEKLPEK